MAELTVEMDAKAMLGAIDRAPAKAGRAIVRSVKRGTMAGKTLMARLVAKDMGFKVGDVKNQIISRDPRANDPVPTGELRASLKRIPLIKFRAQGPEPSRGQGRGVSHKVQGGRKRLPEAFIATVGGQHKGVFMRRGTRRLPIRELFGPSIGRVFVKHQKQVTDRAQEQVSKELKHNLQFLLGDR